MSSSLASRSSLPITASEVAQILAGNDCDGGPMPSVPSFPRSKVAQDALLLNAERISAMCLALNPSSLVTVLQRTTLIRRLAAYLIATAAYDRPLDLATVYELARYLAARPDALNRAGINGVLRRSKPVRPTQCEVVTLIPEPLIYAEGPFQLFELAHPNHLVQEGQLMKNCLGTTFDVCAAEKAGASPGDHRYLTYWRRIAKRKSRLFSLRTRSGQILATLEYDVKTRHIGKVQFGSSRRNRAIVSCMAKFLLKAGIDLNSLPPPFYLKKPEVLLVSGEWAPYRPALLDQIVGGYVSVPATTSVDELRHLIVHPGLHLTIGEDNDQMMAWLEGPISCCSLYSFGRVWPEGITRITNHVYFQRLRKGRFTELESITGVLVAESLVAAVFPKLVTLNGLLAADSLAHYNFPVLKKIDGSLRLPKYIQKSLPKIDAEDLELEESLRSFDLAWDHPD